MELQWLWLGACVALLLGLAYYRRKLTNLVNWLSHPEAGDPPRAYGLWDDLHALLHRAGIPAPYILVGHSLGGMNARVYNGLYPTEVAGAVLVLRPQGLFPKTRG